MALYNPTEQIIHAEQGVHHARFYPNAFRFAGFALVASAATGFAPVPVMLCMASAAAGLISGFKSDIYHDAVQKLSFHQFELVRDRKPKLDIATLARTLRTQRRIRLAPRLREKLFEKRLARMVDEINHQFGALCRANIKVHDKQYGKLTSMTVH